MMIAIYITHIIISGVLQPYNHPKHLVVHVPHQHHYLLSSSPEEDSLLEACEAVGQRASKSSRYEVTEAACIYRLSE